MHVLITLIVLSDWLIYITFNPLTTAILFFMYQEMQEWDNKIESLSRRNTNTDVKKETDVRCYSYFYHVISEGTRKETLFAR